MTSEFLRLLQPIEFLWSNTSDRRAGANFVLALIPDPGSFEAYLKEDENTRADTLSPIFQLTQNGRFLGRVYGRIVEGQMFILPEIVFLNEANQSGEDGPVILEPLQNGLGSAVEFYADLEKGQPRVLALDPVNTEGTQAPLLRQGFWPIPQSDRECDDRDLEAILRDPDLTKNIRRGAQPSDLVIGYLRKDDDTSKPTIRVSSYHLEKNRYEAGSGKGSLETGATVEFRRLAAHDSAQANRLPGVRRKGRVELVLSLRANPPRELASLDSIAENQVVTQLAQAAVWVDIDINYARRTLARDQNATEFGRMSIMAIGTIAAAKRYSLLSRLTVLHHILAEIDQNAAAAFENEDRAFLSVYGEIEKEARNTVEDVFPNKEIRAAVQQATGDETAQKTLRKELTEQKKRYWYGEFLSLLVKRIRTKTTANNPPVQEFEIVKFLFRHALKAHLPPNTVAVDAEPLVLGIFDQFRLRNTSHPDLRTEVYFSQRSLPSVHDDQGIGRPLNTNEVITAGHSSFVSEHIVKSTKELFLKTLFVQTSRMFEEVAYKAITGKMAEEAGIRKWTSATAPYQRVFADRSRIWTHKARLKIPDEPTQAFRIATDFKNAPSSMSRHPDKRRKMAGHWRDLRDKSSRNSPRDPLSFGALSLLPASVDQQVPSWPDISGAAKRFDTLVSEGLHLPLVEMWAQQAFPFEIVDATLDDFKGVGRALARETPNRAIENRLYRAIIEDPLRAKNLLGSDQSEDYFNAMGAYLSTSAAFNTPDRAIAFRTMISTSKAPRNTPATAMEDIAALARQFEEIAVVMENRSASLSWLEADFKFILPDPQMRAEYARIQGNLAEQFKHAKSLDWLSDVLGGTYLRALLANHAKYVNNQTDVTEKAKLVVLPYMGQVGDEIFTQNEAIFISERALADTNGAVPDSSTQRAPQLRLLGQVLLPLNSEQNETQRLVDADKIATYLDKAFEAQIANDRTTAADVWRFLFSVTD